MKKCFYLSLFLIVSINTNSIAALIINDRNINESIKPGQALTSEFENPADIALKLHDGRLKINYITLPHPQETSERFDMLKKCKLTQYNSGISYNIRSGLSISLESTAITSAEDIFLTAGSSLELFGVILKSEDIFFGCNSLDVQDCIIEANTLEIKVSNPQSLIKVIRLTFNKNSSVLNAIEGKIDFTSNEIDGAFVILGLRRIDIVFADKAFK